MRDALPPILMAAAGAALGALVGPAAVLAAPGAVAASYLIAHVICDVLSGSDA